MKKLIASLVLGLALPILWLCYSVFVPSAGTHFYGAALQLLGSSKIRDGVAPVLLVEVDNSSLDAEGGWPWAKDRRLDLLQRLAEWGARAIVVDASFLGDSGAVFRSSDWQALVQRTTVVAPLLDQAGVNPCGRVWMPAPEQGLEEFRVVKALTPRTMECREEFGLGLDSLLTENLRYPLIWNDGQKLVPSLALAALFATSRGDDGNTNWWNPEKHSITLTRGNLRVQSNGAVLLRPLGAPGASVNRVSAASVLQGQVSADQFKDRIVVVGATADGLVPQLEVPFSGAIVGNQMARPEVTANAISGLIDQDFYVESPYSTLLGFVLFVVMGGGIAIAVRLRKLWLGWAVVAGTMTVALLGTWFAFQDLRVWINPSSIFVMASAAAAVLVLRPWKRKVLPKMVEKRTDYAFATRRQEAPAPPIEGLVSDSSFERLAGPVARTADEVSSVYMLAKGDDGRVVRGENGAILQIGRYTQLKPLASGGMSKVYEAWDPLMDRRVAIKILRSDKARSNTTEQRFLREAKVAGSLNHPNINTVFDFGQIDEILFLVLEFVDGQTLSQWIRENTGIPPRRVVSWVRQIASALDAAHRAQVTHRDVKPSNFMIMRSTGAIKLMDFGVARTPDVSLTQAGTTVGTPNYMSPEQLQGSRVGPLSDQYSFGIVVYQMLSQRQPFHGDNLTGLCNNIIKGNFTKLSVLRPDLAGSVENVIHRAFSVRAEDRYANCMAFAEALERALES